MSDIRIRIGVAVDASAAAVLAPIEAAAKRARKTISSEMAAAGKAVADETKKGATSAEREWAKLEKELEREANKILRDQARAEREATRIVAKEAKTQAREKAKAAADEKRAATQAAREKIKLENDVARAKVRAIADEKRAAAQAVRDRIKLEREAARAIAAARRLEESKEKQRALSIWRRDLGTGKALQPGTGGAIGIGRRAGIRVSRGTALAYGLAGRAASEASDVALDLAHGLGYDTDLESHVRKSRDERSLAAKISNAGNVPGTRLVAPDEILAKSREVGIATATDTGEALDALRAFVNKTGDLQTGLTSLESMAKLSKATGTNLEDMANAAAEVTNNLGNAPDKAQQVDVIMKAIAGQGKLGAVEIRQMASQMAKLASVSHSFTGGAKTIIPLMGVFAQESKLAGGSASATQAATSVMRLASDLTNKTTLKNWAAMRVLADEVDPKTGKKTGRKAWEGLSPFLKGSHQTILDDPQKIILTALSATRGNIPKLNSLFQNQMSRRAVSGFANVYRDSFRATSGTEEQKNTAAIAAVTAEFDRLKAAQLDQEEVDRAFAATMRLSESKATIFNNKMTAISDQLVSAVAPHLDQLGDAAVKAAGFLAGLVDVVLPGAKRDKVTQEGKDLLGEEGKLEGALDRTKKIDPKTGKVTYSSEAYEALKGTAVQRNAVNAKLAGNIEEETAAAKSFSIADKLDIFGIIAKASRFVGVQTAGGRAEELQRQAAQDQKSLDALSVEQHNAVDAMNRVERAIRDQTAELTKPPPPSADQSGRAPANADH